MSPSNFPGDSLQTHIAIEIKTQQIYTNLDFVTWKNKAWLQNKTSIIGFLVSYPPQKNWHKKTLPVGTCVWVDVLFPGILSGGMS